jgi:hypothetical protein
VFADPSESGWKTIGRRTRRLVNYLQNERLTDHRGGAGEDKSVPAILRQKLPFNMQKYAVEQSDSAVSERGPAIGKTNLCHGRIFSPRHSRPTLFWTIPKEGTGALEVV